MVKLTYPVLRMPSLRMRVLSFAAPVVSFPVIAFINHLLAEEQWARD